MPSTCPYCKHEIKPVDPKKYPPVFECKPCGKVWGNPRPTAPGIPHPAGS